MGFISLVAARTVLLVSDELLFIYECDSKGVRLVASVPWDAENFEKDVASIIAKDCGRKPVIILNDMVEQHYRKERVMRKGVGMLDRASMVERKLAHAFPNYPIRASFPLKEKLKKAESAGVPTDVYIFAAIPNSIQFLKTLEAVKLSLASIVTVALLPVEASDMVKKLADKIQGKKKQKAKWTVFLGQHQSGGLRQIVTKNGEIALTRITPVTVREDDPSGWAAEAFQAFTSTMSYVSRFGYQPEEGLKVIVVANPESSQAFERLMEEAHDYSALTPVQAAKMLGLTLGKADAQGYADRLHVAWLGRKSKFILPMQAEQISKVSNPRKYAMAAMILMGLGACFLLYQIFAGIFALSTLGTDIEDAESKHQQLQIQYEKEAQRKEALGFDVKLVQSSIAVHDKLEADNVEPLKLFDSIGKALGPDMRFGQVTLQKLDITGSNTQPAKDEDADEKAAKPMRYEITLQATFPSTTNIDKGNEEVANLRDRIQSNLPDCEVKVTKFLKDYAYVDEITVETGNTNSGKPDLKKQDFVVELVIRGR